MKKWDPHPSQTQTSLTAPIISKQINTDRIKLTKASLQYMVSVQRMFIVIIMFWNEFNYDIKTCKNSEKGGVWFSYSAKKRISK